MVALFIICSIIYSCEHTTFTKLLHSVHVRSGPCLHRTASLAILLLDRLLLLQHLRERHSFEDVQRKPSHAVEKAVLCEWERREGGWLSVQLGLGLGLEIQQKTCTHACIHTHTLTCRSTSSMVVVNRMPKLAWHTGVILPRSISCRRNRRCGHWAASFRRAPWRYSHCCGR